MKANRRLNLRHLYLILRNEFGFLKWWPGESRFEIMVGAMLTQQSTWNNVEKALSNLKTASLLEPEKLAAARLSRIEKLVKPSGFYRQKAKRIRNLAKYLCVNYPSLDAFVAKDESALRKELLGLDGIGNETADDIILYVAEKPIFVIDAYTRRILNRMYNIRMDLSYGQLQQLFHKTLPKDVELYKDFHGQLVELAKRNCNVIPKCEPCPAKKMCGFAKNANKKDERTLTVSA